MRSFDYKVLRSIELGLVKWGDSFEPFKQTFFLRTALLPAPVPCPTTGKKQPKPPISSSSIPRGDICDVWSWYEDCTNTACSKLHICVVCKRSDHCAVNCPKRKFPVPHATDYRTLHLLSPSRRPPATSTPHLVHYLSVLNSPHS